VRGIDKRARYQSAEHALGQVRLAGWENRYPDELSGGMQQRVGLARAMAANPDILLMDEPFSALDPLIRRDLQDQFVELAAATRKTTLFVTHDLEEAVRIGSRIAVMKDGAFVQIGTPEDILLNPDGEYVGAFVQSMSKLRLITAERVMQRLDLQGSANIDDDSLRVSTRTSFEHLVHLATTSDLPLVVTENDIPVGIVTRKCLLNAVKSDLVLN
jgi:glycine betaine/proline transport system ATP-binding protein